MWDELAVAAWLDPSVVTVSKELLVDVDTSFTAGYGDTLSWPIGDGPGLGERPVQVVLGHRPTEIRSPDHGPAQPASTQTLTSLYFDLTARRKEALVHRLVRQDLLARETIDLVREHQPLIRSPEYRSAASIAAIAGRLVVNRRDPNLLRQICAGSVGAIRQ